jgi:hypothetical protein
VLIRAKRDGAGFQKPHESEGFGNPQWRLDCAGTLMFHWQVAFSATY